MIEHALWLAANGFSVFPLRPQAKTPATKNGFKDASRDPAQIKAWWGFCPAYNIGIATGAASNTFVVDVDGPEGEAALQQLGPLPETLSARTGKGRHLFFLYPGQGATIGASRIGAKIDHRSDGGYVVAAPSVHPSGAVYAWENLAPMAPLPAAILQRLSAPKQPPVTTQHVHVNQGLDSVDTARESLSLKEHVQALIQAAPGTKHDTLVRAAWAHSCAAHEALEPRDQAEPRLLGLLCGALSQNLLSPVDDWSNAEAAVRSALDKAYSRPLPERLASFESDFSEDGLARRFAKKFRESVCFVPGQGWRVFDGRRWAEQPGNGMPTEYISKMLIELQLELEGQDQEKLAKIIKEKRTAGSMSAILRVASRHMSIPFDVFDRDPLVLNVLNGTVDLRSGQLRPHSPADLLTRCCAVAFDASARCDGWLAALSQMQRGDASALEYLRQLFGSFIQGRPVDGFWIMYGNGFDGKSTCLEVLHGVLGDYARPINPQAILVAKNGSRPHTSMVGGLAGARLGTIDEIPADCQLDTGAVKSYFGRLPVRLQPGMGKDFVDVFPTAKGILATNHFLRIDEHDFGTKRRIQAIPFDANLRALGVKKDDTFSPRLVAQEGPGILAWLVSGCMSWLSTNGQLPPCERVDQATAELFDNDDTVGRFLEACVRGAQVSCLVNDLYAAYVDFATEAKDYVMSKRAFGNRVRERGLQPYKGTKGARLYVGITPVRTPRPPGT